MKIAAVIAFRNEPDLHNTTESLGSTCRCRVFCIEDKAGDGCGVCRHYGITKAIAAGYDTILVCDAHMRFAPGAIDTMAEYVEANPRALAVARCYHNETCEIGKGSPYTAARFTLKTDAGAERVALCAQWNETPTVGRVGAVMGACYVMRADWYQTIGQPLQYLHSWGFDEEYLSACTWFAGGWCECLPVDVAHLYRGRGVAPGAAHNSPAGDRVQLVTGIWANRLQLLDILPLTADQRADLRCWNMSSADCGNLYDLIEMRMRKHADGVAGLRDRLAVFGRNPAEFFAEARPQSIARVGKCAEIVQPTARRDPVIVERPREICPRCDTVDPWRQTSGMRNFGDARSTYARCRRCGAPGKIVVG